MKKRMSPLKKALRDDFNLTETLKVRVTKNFKNKLKKITKDYLPGWGTSAVIRHLLEAQVSKILVAQYLKENPNVITGPTKASDRAAALGVRK